MVTFSDCSYFREKPPGYLLEKKDKRGKSLRGDAFKAFLAQRNKTGAFEEILRQYKHEMGLSPLSLFIHSNGTCSFFSAGLREQLQTEFNDLPLEDRSLF